MASHRLSEIFVLIADSDYQMGQVLADALKHMGIGQVQHVRNGKDAMQTLQKQHVDLLITEWQMWPVDGIALVSHLRSINDSRSRMLPVIMLTGRAEKIDVESARDAGITEFIVKPYTTQQIFQRIKAIVDTPRATVVAPKYIGPDRRRRDVPLENPEADKRRQKPAVLPDAKTVDQGLAPGIVLPDFALKKRIGITAPLETIITPEVLASAQRTIDNLKEESAHWISADLREAESCYRDFSKNPTPDGLDKLRAVVLSIKARAGTFGYHSLSEAAQLTYRFLRNHYQLSNRQHLVVLSKCMESIKILLASGINKSSAQTERALLSELQLMISKFSPPPVL